MFNLKGLLQALGLSLLVTMFFSFLFGFFGVVRIEVVIITIFFISYISIGVFAPIWNRKTPYFAAFIGSITLTVVQLSFSSFFLRLPTFIDPIGVNQSLTFNAVLSLLAAWVMITVLNKRDVNYD